MGLLLQDMKLHIFRNGCEINFAQHHAKPSSLTMCIVKKVDHHRIQWLVTNAM
jgi:hypothetical protein